MLFVWIVVLSNSWICKSMLLTSWIYYLIGKIFIVFSKSIQTIEIGLAKKALSIHSSHTCNMSFIHPIVLSSECLIMLCYSKELKYHSLLNTIYLSIYLWVFLCCYVYLYLSIHKKSFITTEDSIIVYLSISVCFYVSMHTHIYPFTRTYSKRLKAHSYTYLSIYDFSSRTILIYPFINSHSNRLSLSPPLSLSIYLSIWEVQAVVGNAMIVGVLTHCSLLQFVRNLIAE